MRRTVLAALAGLLTGLGTLSLPHAQAAGWTASSYTSRLITLVNQARQQQGLPSLAVASGTTQVAAGWTAHLDASGSLAHNPDLRHQLETHGSPDWTDYGENVGRGPSDNPDALFQAYMSSSEHRVNILSSAYRYMGVAVVLDADTAWNTFDFVDTYHSGTSSATPAKPSPKPTPRPVSRPATQPTVPPPAARATAAAGPPVATSPPSRHPARTSRTARTLPHTAARTAARNMAGRADVADLAALLGDAGPDAGAGRRAVLAAVPSLPRPLSPSSQLPFAVAGLLVGFVGVRWLQQSRLPHPAPQPVVAAPGAPRDPVAGGSLVCAGPARPVLEVEWTATSPRFSPPASARPSTALRRLRSPISSRPSSLPSGRAAARR